MLAMEWMGIAKQNALVPGESIFKYKKRKKKND